MCSKGHDLTDFQVHLAEVRKQENATLEGVCKDNFVGRVRGRGKRNCVGSVDKWLVYHQHNLAMCVRMQHFVGAFRMYASDRLEGG